MHTALTVPLVTFALMALVVAITQMVRIHDMERDVARRVHFEQMEHERKMQELEQQLERVRQGR